MLNSDFKTSGSMMLDLRNISYFLRQKPSTIYRILRNGPIIGITVSYIERIACMICLIQKIQGDMRI